MKKSHFYLVVIAYIVLVYSSSEVYLSALGSSLITADNCQVFKEAKNKMIWCVLQLARVKHLPDHKNIFFCNSVRVHFKIASLIRCQEFVIRHLRSWNRRSV